MFKFLLLPVLIIFIFTSCNLGVVNGEDLVGKWRRGYEYFFTFKADNTGYYEELQSDSGRFSNRNFKWYIKQGQFYKIVDIGEIQYEYYFDIEKKVLYMRQDGYPSFLGWDLYKEY